ncbi:LCP family glycopolymer transferase [Jeotgalibaca arthritidis]|uniref:Transcriptional regulator n=1 Tax=Jeotgalibaca arthritidis TaxID=1868794 RepID=A0A6G7KAZ4_9LACT|nr:LCP family protein [Jeotgalibaca arthritidis]QII82438.1 transcriptional regulator [Jeotgalibaca arthritidis]
MSENRRTLHRKKRRNKKIIFVAIALFLMFYTGAWFIFNQVNSSIGNIFNDISVNDKRDGSSVVINQTQPISFVFLGVDNGVDGRETDVGRSDAIIIATLNPNTNKTTLVSIPRDTYALMDGYESEYGWIFYDKITHAYAYGEAEMSINSIQELINVPIDYYVEINMQGLVDIVDAIDGIEVTSPLTFESSGHLFNEGVTEVLNGTEALVFARMRKEDPEGDFGRQKREKLVIEAIINKVLSFETLTNYQTILQTMEDNVKTNLSFKQMTDILAGYRGALENIEQDNLIGEELWLDEIYYLYANPENRLEISNILREELELDSIEIEELTLSDTDWNYLYNYYYVEDDTSEEVYEDNNIYAEEYLEENQY